MSALPLDDLAPVGDDIRDRLLAAAAEVFAEKGFEGAGVQEIARRAGLTTGAIYGRFTGKAELLLEAIDGSSTREFDELFAQHAFDRPATDILRTVGAHLVTRGGEDADRPDRPELLLEALVTARRDPEVAERLTAVVEQRADALSELMTLAKQDGSIDPALDTTSLVRFCHAVSLGFVLVEALDLDVPGEAPWTALVDRIVDGLAAPTDPSPDTPTDTEPPPAQEA